MALTSYDYLLIGHIAQDRQPDGSHTLGGTVSFTGRVAHAIGHRVAIFTSATPATNLTELAELMLHIQPTPANTIFENTYTASGRRQILHARATPLTPPATLPSTPPTILHLAPICDEVDPAWANHWPTGFVGLTPQGWLRQWDQSGHISPREWQNADALLARADAVVLSEEDVAEDWALLRHWARKTRILAVTRGGKGARIFINGQASDFPAPSAIERDPTGAGDVFAAVFFSVLQRTNNLQKAARQALQAASFSVTQHGLAYLNQLATILQND